MIYEKRHESVNVKTEDLPIKSTPMLVQNSKTPTVHEGVRYDLREQVYLPPRRKRHKAAGRVRGAATVLFVLLICAVFYDLKFFHGRFLRFAGQAVRSGTQYALQSTDRETAVENTLYTRLVSDISQNKEQITNVGVKEPQEQAEMQAQSVSASGEEAMAGSVDGERFYPIISLDLSAQSVFAISNGTALSPDTQGLSGSKPTALENVTVTQEPLVLVLHTHGEECYTGYDTMYPETEQTRSDDTEKNVVRVGKEICDTLSDFGIGAVHCRKMHDSESFINAYTSSAQSVKKYLAEYPSIRIVVDVHRDAIIRENGESIRTVTEIAGQDYAQLMFVVGTNELGHNHPGWQDNLSLALTLQKSIDSTYPSLCRSINLRNVPFNQQLSGGCLLLEVGTCANTLEQALRSARAFGENLARVLVSAAYDT